MVKMTITTHAYGYEATYDKEKNIWVYSDTKEPVTKVRHCKYCGKFPTKEDYDGCIGELPGVKHACCGHGEDKEAYIQFLDGKSIHGNDAITIMQILKKYS